MMSQAHPTPGLSFGFLFLRCRPVQVNRPKLASLFFYMVPSAQQHSSNAIPSNPVTAKKKAIPSNTAAHTRLIAPSHLWVML